MAASDFREGSSSRREEEIPLLDLRAFFDVLYDSRWLIAGIALACTLAAAGSLFVLRKQYAASILLSPVNNQGPVGLGGALSSTLSQLGGVASLAGLSLGGDSSMRAESIATLQSEALTSRYIKENDLLPVLFAGAWDPQRKAWNTKDGKNPTLWTGNAYFNAKIREVKEESRTGLVTMTITWTDPKRAAEWANGLTALANTYLRDKAIEESQRNIAYLSEQASKTNVVELRSALYALMESEIKKEMLARGSAEYALKVIDPAVAPEEPTFPRPLLMIAAGIVGGLVLGVLAAVIRHSIRQRRPVMDSQERRA